MSKYHTTVVHCKTGSIYFNLTGLNVTKYKSVNGQYYATTAVLTYHIIAGNSDREFILAN